MALNSTGFNKAKDERLGSRARRSAVAVEDLEIVARHPIEVVDVHLIQDSENIRGGIGVIHVDIPGSGGVNVAGGNERNILDSDRPSSSTGVTIDVAEGCDVDVDLIVEVTVLQREVLAGRLCPVHSGA